MVGEWTPLRFGLCTWRRACNTGFQLISDSFSLILATRGVEDFRKGFYYLNQLIPSFFLWQYFIKNVQILKREVDSRGVFEVE
jgi:hypothetical protein